MTRGVHLALWLVLALVSGPGRGDFRQSYLDGMKAARRGQWDRVIELMREAVAGDPIEKERVRLVGAIPVAYLPHFYLGKAHYAKRDCDAALAEWRRSLEQRAIRSRADLFDEVERGSAHCQDLGRAARALARAGEAATRLEASVAGRSEHWGAADEARRRQATKSLAAARSAYAASRAAWTPESASAAALQAAAIAPEIDGLREEVERRSHRARHRELRAGLEAPVAEGRRLLAEAMDRPPTLALQRAAMALDAQLARAGSLSDDTALDALEQLSRDLASTVERVRRILDDTTPDAVEVATTGPSPSVPPPAAPPAPPPAAPPAPPSSETALPAAPVWLVEGAQAYFDGEFQRAVEILDGTERAQGRVLFFSRLFRGAARYALFLLGSDGGAARLDAALLDLRACRRADPEYQPRRDYFSPRFIELYSSAE